MPDGLDRYIRKEITTQFKNKLAVVLRPEDADAIMAAVGRQKIGSGQSTTDRRVGLIDMSSGSVSVLDKKGKLVLWSSELHNQGVWWGATTRGGLQKVANHLVHNLKTAMGQ